MGKEYADIRERMEESGYSLADGEFTELVDFARRKAEIAGKDESYVPLLLPDVIRERAFRVALNARAAALMG